MTIDTKVIDTREVSKIVMFTDIHWGAKSNSHLHNTDCKQYIDWLIQKIKKEKPSHIMFLGDWFENRNSINVQTLKQSYRSLKKLDKLGIPILFIVGNHDLYRRDSRDIHSVDVFEELENVILIDSPATINDKYLLMPYLFDKEYAAYAELINSHKYVFGHFEFKNFIVTGYNMTMKHGPNHELFNKPEQIFSGHFHKRQANGNVAFIGNAFPSNYGDAGDFDRGCCTFDTKSGDIRFENWDDCPTYLKTSLSKILSDQWTPRPKMRVRCTVDIEISYSEAQLIKETLIEQHQLRELSLEECDAKKEVLEGDEDSDLGELESKSINEVVVTLIEGISDVQSINTNKLVQIYNSLSVGIK